MKNAKFMDAGFAGSDSHAVTCTAKLQDGRAVCGMANGEIRIMNEFGAPQECILNCGSHIVDMAVLPDGRLASVLLYGHVQVWDTKSRKCVEHWESNAVPHKLHVLSNGNIVVSMYSCLRGEHVLVWDPNTDRVFIHKRREVWQSGHCESET